MNVINKIFVMLVVAGLMFCAIVSIISPVSINNYENRQAQKMPVPGIESIASNKFQNDVELAIADQMPLSGKLKKGYNYFNSMFIIKTIEPIVKTESDKYIKYKSINFYGQNQLVYDVIELEDVKEELNSKFENLNSTFENNPDTDFYVYYIEKDTDINFETGEKMGLKEYVFDGLNIPKDKKSSFDINSIEDFRELFYHTDHHWNNKGSYKAYCELIELLKPEDTPIPKGKEVLVSKNYSGSKNSKLGYNFYKEDFYAYEFDYKDMKITINGESANDYGNQKEFLNDNRNDIAYGTFYGGDDGEVIFSTGENDNENILIVGESFDNAVLKLVATHFNNTHSIDLRFYESYMKKPFSFQKYIKEHEIDKVLLIGNINYFSSEDFILR